MKKIIKNASPVRCDTCGCIFTYEDVDTYITSKMAPSWLFGLPIDRECKAVKCPGCGEVIALKWLS